MASAPMDAPVGQPSSSSSPVGEPCAAPSRFSKLRGVRWRMDLGILPSSPDTSIEDIRRVAADSRRRYASLRRRLLIDPHIYKDGSRSPGLVMDNPLSQSPDSMWGRFFQNAELEKLVDQDLSRLYPEHGSYFQTATCQAMLRRILLLWCLRHPEYGYRQGMHELVAPLLYVLQMDVRCLSQVRELHVDQFSDEFDGNAFPECVIGSNYRIIDNTSRHGETVEESFGEDMDTVSSLDDLDPETRDIILLSDAYGAEGELGIVLSERFMEHDAYSMFDVLMNGAHGMVAIADFFSPPPSESRTGLSPVIEASTALYHLLSIVDTSLHSHLVGLNIEPQYFALRWLRVLFAREFLLRDLLVLWDELFSHPSSISLLGTVNESGFNFRIFCSPRGSFIAAVAVSMILHLRSSLLATGNATTCLQRLLNFPENVNMKMLIDKAKSILARVVDANISTHLGAVSHRNKPTHIRSHSLSSGLVSLKTPLYSLPESYWEEKWRVLHRTEEPKERQTDPISKGILKKAFNRGRFSLSRTESDSSPAKIMGVKEGSRSTVRHRLSDGLSQEEDSEMGNVKSGCGGISDPSGTKDSVSMETVVESDWSQISVMQATLEKNINYLGEEGSLSGESSSVFCMASSPPNRTYDHENDSNKSCVTSNSCPGDSDYEDNPAGNSICNSSNNLVHGDSDSNSATTFNHVHVDVKEKRSPVVKEKKLLFGKFQWFWKFGKGASEGNIGKGNAATHRSTVTGNVLKGISESSSVSYGSTSEVEVGDKKVDTLRNLGQSMLEDIQVLESVFQQDRHEAGSLENLSNSDLGGKGQVTAMAALKELRKISNLLYEM